MKDRRPSPARDRRDRLDELLERAGRVREPAGLAQDIGRRLRDARSEAARAQTLERWLDRVPAPEVPPGLAQRVLRGLARRRSPSRREPSPWKQAALWSLASAAALVLALGWFLFRERGVRGLDGKTEVAQRQDSGGADAPEELLEVLDVLESWELLTSDDLDLLLAGLDAGDESLLELNELLGTPEVNPDQPGAHEADSIRPSGAPSKRLSEPESEKG